MIECILFAFFVILQIGDFWTTYRCITTGKGNEANPVVAYGIQKIGLIPALTIYKILALGVGVCLTQTPQALAVIDIIYLYIVTQNYNILRN